MKVFKFGGASINSPERFINSASIIQSFLPGKILVIVSAMGKTTNGLEEVVSAYTSGDKTKALRLFDEIKQSHYDTLISLNLGDSSACKNALQNHFTEIEWMLHDNVVKTFDFYYDQIVCSGELFSTTLLFHLLQKQDMKATWLDVRDVIRTDNHFRNATIDWEVTAKNVASIVAPKFDDYDVIVTQGFIGATDENESTTLGREGSDYSAAVFANLLQGESVTIWKDVEAVMSADPKKYPNASVISSLSYKEVIEMAYYGAQVIHPKTIKPLQNKQIPLLVKSFLNPQLQGTRISDKGDEKLPPIIVNKENQVMIAFTTKDFSFIDGTMMSQLTGFFSEQRISPNISQQTAISVLCSFDDIPDKIESLCLSASSIFDVTAQKNLTLLTVRHYDENILATLKGNREVILHQQTRDTIQLLLRQIN